MKYQHAAVLLAAVSQAAAIPLSVATFYTSLQNVFNSFSTGPSFSTSASPAPASLIPEQEYESWIDSESNIAFEGIIQNIGGYGSVEGVMPGAVVASPSKQYPNYFFQVRIAPFIYVYVSFLSNSR